MHPHFLRLLALLLLLSTCQLSYLQKLPATQDFIALSKLLNLPYSPYFVPQLPLPPVPDRRKLFGLPPLPDSTLDEAITTTTAVTQLAVVSDRTTLPPLLRLLTLPPITLPPPPKIDSYGINTIPELPPQHESIYAGMFAPDGSLIEKKNSSAGKDTDVKQTETNQIYDEEESLRKAGGVRGPRAAAVRLINDRVAHDDHDDYDDETVARDFDESKSMTSFLRRNPTSQADGISLQPAKAAVNAAELPANSIEVTTPLTFGLVSLNTDATTTGSSETEMKVKSTTLTRLPVFVSSESDPAMKKRGKILALKTEGDGDQQPRRVFPQLRRSKLQIIPVQPAELASENGTVIESPAVHLKGRKHDLDRTTVRTIGLATQPHAAILNRKVEKEEALDVMASRAKDLLLHGPKLTAAQRHGISSMFTAEQPYTQVNSAPAPDQSVLQQQHGGKWASQEPQLLISRKMNRKTGIQTHLLRPIKVVHEKVPHVNSLPIAKVLPKVSPAASRTLQNRVALEASPRSQQQLVTWTRTIAPRVWVTPAPGAVVQYIPAVQHYYDNTQYQAQQQQQQQLLGRDPQDEAYLREVEDYDRFWEAQNARASAAQIRPPVATVPVIDNQRVSYKQTQIQTQDNALSQRARVAASQTGHFVVHPSPPQPQQQIYQEQAYAPQIYDGFNGETADLRELSTNFEPPALADAQLQQHGVFYPPTSAPLRLFASISPIPLVFAQQQQLHQQQQQQLQLQQQQQKQQQLLQPNAQSVTAQSQLLPKAAFTLRPDSLIRSVFGSIFGNQPQSEPPISFPGRINW